METLFYRMITNGLIVLALVPVVWLLCRAFRKQPATQNLLWLLLLAKLTLAPILIWSFSFESDLIDFLAKKEPAIIAPADAIPLTQLTTDANPKAAGIATVDSPEVVTFQPEHIDNSISEQVEPKAISDPLIEETDARPLTHFPAQSLANYEPTPADAPIVADPAIQEPEETIIAATPSVSPIAVENPPQKASTPPLLASILKIVRSPDVIWYGSIIWLVGCLAFGLNAARKLTATRNLIKNSLPCSIELAQISQEVAEKFRIRRIEVREVPGLDSPCVVAFGRVKILWPAEMNPAAQGCRAIMAHEIVHIKRRDHWAMWLEMIAGVMWWWNPACYFIRRRLHETRELACDAVALAQLGEEPSDYAQKLIDLTTGQSFRASRHLPACSVGAVSKNSLQRRLVMLFEDRIVGRTSRLGLLAGLLIAALVVPTIVFTEQKLSQNAAAETPTTKSTKSDEEQVDSVVSQMMSLLRSGHHDIRVMDISKVKDPKSQDSGVETIFESLLTPIAYKNLMIYKLTPPGDPTIHYKVIEKKIEKAPERTGEKITAEVKCEIGDKSLDEVKQKLPVTWKLLKNQAGWKISGVSVTFPTGKIYYINFEDSPSIASALAAIHRDRGDQESKKVVENQPPAEKETQSAKIEPAAKKNTIQPFDTFTLEYAINEVSTKNDLQVSSSGLIFVKVRLNSRNTVPIAVKINGEAFEGAERMIRDAITEQFKIQRNVQLDNVGVQITKLSKGSVRLAEFEKNRKKVIHPGDGILIENNDSLPQGNFTVEEEGTLALGARFGRVAVAGKTVDEATQLLFEHLSKKSNDIAPTFGVRYFKKPEAQLLDNPFAAAPQQGASLSRNTNSPHYPIGNPIGPSPLDSPLRAPNPGPSTHNPFENPPAQRAAKRYEFQIKFFSGDPNGTVKDGTIKVLQAPKITADEGQTVYCHEGSDPKIVVQHPSVPGSGESVIYETAGWTITARTMGEKEGKVKVQIQAVTTTSGGLAGGKISTGSMSTVNVVNTNFGEPNKIEFNSGVANPEGYSHWAEVTVTEGKTDERDSNTRKNVVGELTPKQKKQVEREQLKNSAQPVPVPVGAIMSGDELKVHATTSGDDLINGKFVVESMGTIPLGPAFGRVKVIGKTIEEAEKIVNDVLAKFYGNTSVQITQDRSVTRRKQLRIDASNIDIEYAKKAAEVTMSRYTKLVEANKAAPNSVGMMEIEEAKLMYERALLEIKRGEIERALIESSNYPSDANQSKSEDAETEKNVELMQIEVEKLKKELESERLKLKRVEKEVSDGTRADIELDAVHNEVNKLERWLKENEAELELKQAQIKGALKKAGGTDTTASERQNLDQTSEMLQIDADAAKLKQVSLQSKLKRLKALLDRKAISDEEYETANTEHKFAVLEVRKAEARLDAAKQREGEKQPAKSKKETDNSSDSKKSQTTQSNDPLKLDKVSEKYKAEHQAALLNVEKAHSKLERHKQMLEEKKISAEVVEAVKLDLDKAVAEFRRVESNILESINRQWSEKEAAKLKKVAESQLQVKMSIVLLQAEVEKAKSDLATLQARIAQEKERVKKGEVKEGNLNNIYIEYNEAGSRLRKSEADLELLKQREKLENEQRLKSQENKPDVPTVR